MNIAILIAGGKGSRFGAAIPKQFVEVNGKPIILYSLLLFQVSSCIDKVIVVCASGWQDHIEKLKTAYALRKLTSVVTGGDSRFQSIYNAISNYKQMYCSDDILIIHDSVRPGITEEMLIDGIKKAQQFGASLAASPCFDTMYVSSDGKLIEGTCPRNKLFKGQTPISIRASLAIKAYDEAIAKGFQTDSPAVLLMQLGHKVVLSKGNQFNIKVTVPEDVQLIAASISNNKIVNMSEYNFEIY